MENKDNSTQSNNQLDENVLNYIKRELKRGIPTESVRDTLLKVGHHPLKIDLHFRHIEKQKKRKIVFFTFVLLILIIISAPIVYLVHSHFKMIPNVKIEYYTSKGMMLCSQGRYQDAIEYLDKSIKLNESKAIGHYAKGRCYFLMGNYSEAKMQFLSKVPTVAEVSGKYYSYLGLSYCKTGNYQSGIANLNKAIEINQSNKKFYQYISDCYKEKGDTKSSLLWLNKSLSLVAS